MIDVLYLSSGLISLASVPFASIEAGTVVEYAHVPFKPPQPLVTVGRREIPRVAAVWDIVSNAGLSIILIRWCHLLFKHDPPGLVSQLLISRNVLVRIMR